MNSMKGRNKDTGIKTIVEEDCFIARRRKRGGTIEGEEKIKE